MELEKKKKIATKSVFKGPIIRYHSLTMPILPDATGCDEEEDPDHQPADEKSATSRVQSRNFITFTDEQSLREIFPLASSAAKPRVPGSKQRVCAVTGLTAKYFDPLTQLPYANMYAFRALRQMHAASSSSSGPAVSVKDINKAQQKAALAVN